MENEKYGSEKYTPSRLEWLALILNSMYRAGNLAANHFKLSYSPGSDEKTINVDISYFDDLDIKTLEEVKKVGRDAVQITADNYGWGDWIKININESLVP